MANTSALTENEVALKGENYKLFELAKAMEKQQIMDANDSGYTDGGNNRPTTAEQYYNKTFKSK